MKTCTKCKIEKPFEAFYKSKYTKDGHASECKDCRNIRKIELKKNPLMQLEKQIRSSVLLENKLLAKEGKRLCQKCKEIFLINEMSGGIICYPCKRKREKERRSTKEGKLNKQLMDKKYYEKNKETISQKAKEYIELNKGILAKRKREWYDKNLDKKKEYDKHYNLINKEKRAENCKEYYEKNRDIINEKRKEYRERNKDKLKEYNKKYRLKKKLEKENQITS